MRGRFVHRIVLIILLNCQFSTCLAAVTPDPNDPNIYLNAVREFADNVLKYGRDTYGPKHTPLFVDGLMVREPNNPDYGKDGVYKPVEWISPEGERWVLCNLASQQNLFRTLDGLTAITGDPKYKQAAMDAIEYAFENLRSPNGLLYWGHAAAYDARGDRVHGRTHEIKQHYPYYELMWEVNSNETKKFIESFWSEHILDWSNLDMNRQAPLDRPLRVHKPWEYEYDEDVPTFFKSKSVGVGFFVTGSSLINAGASLYKLSGQEQPLIWSKRLAKRYVDTRHPNTGIGTQLYNQPRSRLGDDLKEHFDDPHTMVFPLINAFTDKHLYHPENFEAYSWMSMLLVGEILGDQGEEFTRWALEELTAWGRAAYRKEDNSFVPMLTDGTSIEGYVWKEGPGAGPIGIVAIPCPLDLPFFWAYSVAYRVTGDEFMWEMVRDIALGNDFGDIGETSKHTPELQTETSCSEVYGLLGFLQLYKGTNKPEYLNMARRISDNILTNRFHKGFFVPTKEHIYGRFDSFEPLALLHLHAAMKSKIGVLSCVWPHEPLFTYPYRHKLRGIDRQIIYTLTESPEPPISLQEAAAIGNIDLVRSLINRGTDVNIQDDSLLRTVLHRAALSGHKDIVELLIDEGADVDRRSSGTATPLHYAAENGHKEIVELLISKGADVTAETNRGYTALHYAVRGGQKDVAELLITNGVDVNAKNNDDQTPLDVAVDNSRKEIVELLITNGADVTLHAAVFLGDLAKVKSLIEGGADINAKNNRGQTPLDIALIRRRKDIVDLLITKGATVTSIHVAARIGAAVRVKAFLEEGIDVNAKDNLGITPMHYASSGGNKDIIELLLAKGADVNANDKRGYTPLQYALFSLRTDVAKLLIDKGADVHIKENNYGYTALQYVIRTTGNRELIEMIISKRVDMNIKNKDGNTALHLAAIGSRKDIVELLIEKGADVNAKNSQGQTPLQLAEKWKRPEIAELLRKHGAKEDKTSKDAPKNISLTDSDKPYVVLERGYVRAVIVNNEPVDDEVLPGHRGGYSGVASLTHRARDKNLFVPFYAGLNFEHIHDGTVKPRDILFEPRHTPMQIKRIDEYTAELYQPPTPNWQLESRLRYQLLEDGAIEMTLECIPRARTFKNDYIGLFFASYIDKPESLDIHFLGRPANKIDAEPRWIRGVTPEHGTLPTHLAVDDNRTFAHDPNFPLTLVFNKSNYRYTEPWYYGVSHGMALVLMFRPEDNVRLSQSPSGGGDGNPAWDFQWFVPQYEVGKSYRFVMRAMYLPFESQQQIIRATARHRADLER